MLPQVCSLPLNVSINTPLLDRPAASACLNQRKSNTYSVIMLGMRPGHIKTEYGTLKGVKCVYCIVYKKNFKFILKCC